MSCGCFCARQSAGGSGGWPCRPLLFLLCSAPVGRRWWWWLFFRLGWLLGSSSSFRLRFRLRRLQCFAFLPFCFFVRSDRGARPGRGILLLFLCLARCPLRRQPLSIDCTSSNVTKITHTACFQSQFPTVLPIARFVGCPYRSPSPPIRQCAYVPAVAYIYSHMHKKRRALARSLPPFHLKSHKITKLSIHSSSSSSSSCSPSSSSWPSASSSSPSSAAVPSTVSPPSSPPEAVVPPAAVPSSSPSPSPSPSSSPPLTHVGQRMK